MATFCVGIIIWAPYRSDACITVCVCMTYVPMYILQEIYISKVFNRCITEQPKTLRLCDFMTNILCNLISCHESMNNDMLAAWPYEAYTYIDF